MVWVYLTSKLHRNDIDGVMNVKAMPGIAMAFITPINAISTQFCANGYILEVFVSFWGFIINILSKLDIIKRVLSIDLKELPNDEIVEQTSS